MTEARMRLADAVFRLRETASRDLNESGVFGRLETGEAPADLSEDMVNDVVGLLDAAIERLRRTRDTVGLLSAGMRPSAAAVSTVEQLAQARLPLNRKERFYTGTVLPMLVASDGFEHLHRFLALCGLPVDPFADSPVKPLDGTLPVQFFSEYSFAESRFTAQDKARFPGPPAAAEAPDIVLCGPDWLLAVEAKMFHTPSPAALGAQMRRQRVLVEYWAEQFEIPRDRVAHAMLVPAGLPTGGVPAKVVTWEQVRDAYATVGPQHWVAVLVDALTRYEQLRSQPSTTNGHGVMTGAAIVEAHAAGNLFFTHMGRMGGLGGAALTKDLDSGSWRGQSYEVRTGQEPPNGNWFAVEEFIVRTA